MSEANDRERVEVGSGDLVGAAAKRRHQGASNEAASGRGPIPFTADGWAKMSPDTQKAIAEMVRLAALESVDSRGSISALEPRGPEPKGSDSKAGATEGAEVPVSVRQCIDHFIFWCEVDLAQSKDRPGWASAYANRLKVAKAAKRALRAAPLGTEERGSNDVSATSRAEEEKKT